jgi:hypothetical protein
MRKKHRQQVEADSRYKETVCGLVGMFLGMGVTAWVGDDQLLLWLCFCVFTFLHMHLPSFRCSAFCCAAVTAQSAQLTTQRYANYASLRLVVLKTFNRQRAHIAISTFLSSSCVFSPE